MLFCSNENKNILLPAQAQSVLFHPISVSPTATSYSDSTIELRGILINEVSRFFCAYDHNSESDWVTELIENASVAGHFFGPSYVKLERSYVET